MPPAVSGTWRSSTETTAPGRWACPGPEQLLDRVVGSRLLAGQLGGESLDRLRAGRGQRVHDGLRPRVQDAGGVGSQRELLAGSLSRPTGCVSEDPGALPEPLTVLVQHYQALPALGHIPLRQRHSTLPARPGADCVPRVSPDYPQTQQQHPSQPVATGGRRAGVGGSLTDRPTAGSGRGTPTSSRRLRCLPRLRRRAGARSRSRGRGWLRSGWRLVVRLQDGGVGGQCLDSARGSRSTAGQGSRDGHDQGRAAPTRQINSQTDH